MKKIKLTRGRFTIVDDEDYKKFSLFKWHLLKTKWGEYAMSSQRFLLHRLIMNAPKKKHVDHVNGDGLDNRQKNLRLCTNAQNGMNRKGLNKNNKSGIRGVYWHKSKKKWVAQIMLNRKHVYLGYFGDKEEANKVCIAGRKKHFGEFV